MSTPSLQLSITLTSKPYLDDLVIYKRQADNLILSEYEYLTFLTFDIYDRSGSLVYYLAPSSLQLFVIGNESLFTLGFVDNEGCPRYLANEIHRRNDL